MLRPTFQADFYVRNRKKLCHVTNVDVIIVSANAQLQAAADMTFPFRQDSHFYYLTGLLTPEAVLVIDVNAGTDYILLPQPSEYAKLFDSKSSLEHVVATSGVSAAYWYDEGWKKLLKLLGSSKKVGITLAHEPYIDMYEMYANPARENLMKNILREYSMSDFVDIRMDIARLRMIKQPEEIVALQKAIDITIDTFLELPKRKYTHEYEVEAELTHGFRRRGASGHGYEPIVAVGKNACTLHYNTNAAVLGSNESLLIDAAAVYQQYTADITRAFSIGQPSQRLVDVVEAVKRASKRCAKALKPGIMMRDYMLTCDEFVGEELITLGLISQNTRDHIRKYYPHSTSHFLGLDAHDAGDYDMPLQTNAVLTIEPGIYIPEENIGVRIEDDYILSETGAVNMSSRLPTDLVILNI